MAHDTYPISAVPSRVVEQHSGIPAFSRIHRFRGFGLGGFRVGKGEKGLTEPYLKSKKTNHVGSWHVHNDYPVSRDPSTKNRFRRHCHRYL